jgi:hypothetical protein
MARAGRLRGVARQAQGEAMQSGLDLQQEHFPAHGVSAPEILDPLPQIFIASSFDRPSVGQRGATEGFLEDA